MTIRVYGALLLALALGACEVGRALVETGAESQIDNLKCEPYACEGLPVPTIPAITDGELDPGLDLCVPVAVHVCEPATETTPGFDRPPAGVCQRTLSLDDDAFDPEALRDLSCAKVRLTRTQAGAGAVLRLEDVRWSQLDLEVESAGELALELVRADLDKLRVRLRGPVTLRVIDSPRLTAVALATDSTSAALDLRASEAQAVRLGTPERAFAGSISSWQSTLKRMHLFARQVELEIVSLQDSTVEAERIRFVDVTSRRLTLAFDHALIGSSRLTAVAVQRCGSLSLFGTNFAGFRVPSCSDAPTRIVSSSFRRGSLDGDILSDSSSFQRTAFGLNEPSDLQLWDSSLSNVNFCANSDRVTLGGKVSADCALCRELDGAIVPIDACTDEYARPLLLKSCRLFDLLDTCDPDPERMRPPFN